jgi:hypothetical protein
MARAKKANGDVMPDERDRITYAVDLQPELDDLKKQVDGANGTYRARLKAVADRGVSPRALSWFRALRAMPDAKRRDTWQDLEDLVRESGLSDQVEMFDDENQRVRRLEPVV